MPRPRKCRRVCHYPETVAFAPVENESGKAAVILTIDEYETLRLIDREEMSQEQCSEYMGIARTTVQLIYTSARKKMADMLVEGRALRIEGGEYQLCKGESTSCGSGECLKRKLHETYKKAKGEKNMRIAVTYENGQIFQHFGHTEQFKIYDIEDGKVIAAEVVSTNGSGHGALAGVLGALHADALICGGIGGGARNALAAAGVELYGGVSGDADQAVADYLAGKLAYNPNVMCSHHGEHHHEGNCGDHGCGEHHCGDHHCG